MSESYVSFYSGNIYNTRNKNVELNRIDIKVKK